MVRSEREQPDVYESSERCWLDVRRRSSMLLVGIQTEVRGWCFNQSDMWA